MRQGLTLKQQAERLAAAKAQAPDAPFEMVRPGNNGTHKTKSVDDSNGYIPFPTHLLPFPVREFVEQASMSMTCDVSYVALPALSAVASAIGNTRRIQLKKGWTEPTPIWTCIVGESGTIKSPCVELAVGPLRHRQGSMITKYEQDLKNYQKDLQRWQDTPRTERGDKPEEPKCQRLYVDDLTVEALAYLLLENPRGLLAVRDELAGFFLSFDAYRNGRGGDLQRWLSIHRAGELISDRKSDKRVIRVRNACLSVTGSIQPETLNKILSRDLFENGMASRFLFACPPERPKTWSDNTVNEEIEKAIDTLFENLLNFDFTQDERGNPKPFVYQLSDDARERWKTFFHEHDKERISLNDSDLKSAWAKLECYAARFALLIHCVKVATGTKTLKDPNRVDMESLNAGIALSNWFGAETKRLYGKLSHTRANTDREELIRWIDKRGGTATVRLAQQRFRRFRRDATLARKALDDLVSEGYGEWIEHKSTEKDGRPHLTFRMKYDEELRIPGNSGNSGNT